MKHLLDEAEAQELERCLLFANTVAWHASDHPHEHLGGYDDLVNWSAAHGAIEGELAEHLRGLAACDSARAEAAFGQAVVIREVIYRIFAAQAQGQAATPDDLGKLNEALLDVASKTRIQSGANGYQWGWVRNDDLDQMLWPLVRAAGNLLTNDAFRQRVGQFADDRGCGWLFLDLSKNHSRRWCDINDCGNRAKQQRYQQRLRGT